MTDNIKSTNMILSRTKGHGVYLPFFKKKKYFDAISSGDTEAISILSEKNYEYPTALFNKSHSYSDAMNKMHYDAICAASEMCLIAIQAGLLDIVAYNTRDEFIKEFNSAVNLADLYDLVHGMAGTFAAKVSYVLKHKKLSNRTIQMISYIKENMYYKMELADIANAVGVSRTYASTIFKQETGVTLSDFILNERLNEAKNLLSETNMTISEISDKLSFCSQSYFTKNFTKINGMTPGEYRNQY